MTRCKYYYSVATASVGSSHCAHAMVLDCVLADIKKDINGQPMTDSNGNTILENHVFKFKTRNHRQFFTCFYNIILVLRRKMEYSNPSWLLLSLHQYNLQLPIFKFNKISIGRYTVVKFYKVYRSMLLPIFTQLFSNFSSTKEYYSRRIVTRITYHKLFCLIDRSGLVKPSSSSLVALR